MKINLDDIERKASAATQDRWQWFGNTKTNEVYLATVHGGRVFVMDFVRWGMTNAQPRFQVRLNGEPGSGIMRSIGDLGKEEHPLGPRFEAPHRRQFAGIGHPDAEHIAAASPPVMLALSKIARAAVLRRDAKCTCGAGLGCSQDCEIEVTSQRLMDALTEAGL